MAHPVIDNVILLFFAQGAYFLLTVVLSLKLLSEYNVRIKLFFGILISFVVLCNIKDLVIYHIPQLYYAIRQQVNWITMTDQLAVPLCGIFLLELIKPRSITAIKAVLNILPFIILLVIYSVNPDSDIITVTIITVVIYSALIIGNVLFNLHKGYLSASNRKIVVSSLYWFGAVVCVWVYSCIVISSYNDILYYVVTGLASYNLYGAIAKYHYEDGLPILSQDESSKDMHKYTFVNNLNRLMHEDRIFLNQHITISEVARLVGTNRSYLSEYLNRSCGSSFSEYINNLRLDYAENLMKDDCAMSIETVSAESGFNSLQTFRRTFVKRHGITPSQYHQNQMA